MVQEVQRLPYTNIIINSKPSFGVNFPETISPIEFTNLAEQIVSHRKNEIEKLKIIGFYGHFFDELLPYFQNLSQLYLFEVTLELSNGYERVNLLNLKILEIEQSRKILNMFKANNLKKIIVHSRLDFDEKFLQYSTKLESLVTYWFNVNYFNSSSLLDLKLKALELNFGSSHGKFMYAMCGNSHNKPIGTGTVNFLLTQKDHLNELSINLGEGNSGIIVKFCLKELKNLTKFSLKTQDNFYLNSDNICVNESVKEWSIKSKANFDIITLMSCCPSTMSLTLNIDKNLNLFILEHISKSMQDLKILQIFINSARLEIIKNVHFENLEKLEITKLKSGSDEIWHQIALVCPNLKELSLNYENIEILPQKLENVLEKCKKLEILSFNADFKFLAVLGFIELMSYKPANLKRINFSAKYYNDYFYKVIKYLARETNIKVYIKNN